MRAAAIASLFAAATFASTADAAVRSYFMPTIEGDRLAFCVSDGKRCGKPVADAWCRFNGHADAILYQRDLTDASARVLFADTGAACTDAACLSFREIKCRGASQEG